MKFQTVDPEDVEVTQFCSFSTAANWLGKYILFNKAPELDTWLLEEVSVEGEDEEGELNLPRILPILYDRLK